MILSCVVVVVVPLEVVVVVVGPLLPHALSRRTKMMLVTRPGSMNRLKFPAGAIHIALLVVRHPQVHVYGAFVGSRVKCAPVFVDRCVQLPRSRKRLTQVNARFRVSRLGGQGLFEIFDCRL